MSGKPSSLGKRLTVIVIVLVLAGGALGAYLSGVQIPGLRTTKANPPEPQNAPRLKVQLVENVHTTWDPNIKAGVESAKVSFDRLRKNGYVAYRVDESGNKGEIMHDFDPNAGKVILSPPKHTISVPEEVRKSLSMREKGKDVVAIAEKPTGKRPLVLSGSTMLDFNNIIRVKARFAPAEIVKIEPYTYITKEGTQQRPLQIGDYVTKGTPLAIFYSIDVGSKKNDLIDAIVSQKFDNDLYERAKQSASLPAVLVEGYRKNVQSDANAIKRARKYLDTWLIPQEDIDAVYKEADDIIKNDGKRKPELEKTNENEIDPWGKVVLKAPASGFIVEQNVAEKELVVDPTVCLYQIANTDKLLISANCPEEEIKELFKLKEKLKELNLPGMQWVLRPLGESESDGILGSIDEIGQLVDQYMHTVPLRGRIVNKDRVMRAGQYVTATIELPPPENVVSIPAAAVADDGKQAIVFIQTDPNKNEYTMRRVVITHRFEKRVFVRTELSKTEKKLSPEDQEQGLLPKETLQLGDRLITSGLLELKKELEDLEAEKGE